MINAKEGTGTYTRLKKIIDAMTISLAHIQKHGIYGCQFGIHDIVQVLNIL